MLSGLASRNSFLIPVKDERTAAAKGAGFAKANQRVAEPITIDVAKVSDGRSQTLVVVEAPPKPRRCS